MTMRIVVYKEMKKRWLYIKGLGNNQWNL